MPSLVATEEPCVASRGKSKPSAHTTKELSPETWPDFEKLFAKHGGVQAGCWCMFYHRRRPLPPEFRGKERAAQNRRDKEAFVQQGRSHGILVYAGEQPVGSCQFGPRDELPRLDAGRIYRKLDLPVDAGKLWRITCFFVDRDYRHKGVAKVALLAALDAIRKKGGGVVEAYPATSRKTVGIWFGTVDMFERERFRTVCAYGNSNVLMRRTI